MGVRFLPGVAAAARSHSPPRSARTAIRAGRCAIILAVPPPATIDDPVLGAIVTWWDQNHRELPWRTTRDVYAIWVAEVMSAQTTVQRAADAWERWVDRWPTVETLANASLGEVLAQWQGLGYPRRARDLHRSAQIIARTGWPEPEQLTTLPGVGPYIAAAIRCFAHEQPVLPRDVNVNRVLARRFPAEVDISADPWRAGQALMEFGQRICTTRPACHACPVRADCPGPDLAAEATARSTTRQKPYAGSFRERRGRLLRQVLAEGRVPAQTADAEAAEDLARDGLIVSDGPWLRAPD
jgi:A/G-specific adenine glycosylase